MTSLESVLGVRRVQTTLQKRGTFELCPSDGLFGDEGWICWPQFYSYQLDWQRLLQALVKVEKVCPVLCGRLTKNQIGNLVVEVDPIRENGLGAVEVLTNRSLAEIRTSERMVAGCSASQTPSMNWPYFLELKSANPILNDQKSLFGVHLVHATNGCVLSVAIKHLLCDGGRLADLLIDISRAYRGLEPSEKQLDRSFCWPDAYGFHFGIPGHSASLYPRKMKPLSLPIEDEAVHLAHVHIPQAAIEAMKKGIRGKLSDVGFVSANDLVTALYWMFKAECQARVHPVSARSLPIRGTTMQLPVDLSSMSGSLFSQNYFGNAICELFVKGDFTEKQMASFMDILGRAASLIRLGIEDVKHRPEATFQTLLVYYKQVNGLTDGQPSVPIGVLPSYVKMPFDHFDFGEGGPVHAFPVPGFPSGSSTGGLALGPNGDGVIAYLCLTNRDRRLLESSSVFSACATGTKLFPKSLSLQDASAIMGLK